MTGDEDDYWDENPYSGDEDLDAPRFEVNTVEFYEASREIEEKLELSRGAAQKTLRDLCASGEVRSWKAQAIWLDGSLMPLVDRPDRITPAQWRTTEVDLEPDGEGGRYLVEVSEDDYRHWLYVGKLKQPIPPSKWLRFDPASLSPDLREAAEKVFKAQREFLKARKALLDEARSKGAEPAKSSHKPQSDLAQQAIAALWSDSIPDPKDIPNKQLETLVTEWIADYCKQHNLPKRGVSRETILRAAGRRR